MRMQNMTIAGIPVLDRWKVQVKNNYELKSKFYNFNLQDITHHCSLVCYMSLSCKSYQNKHGYKTKLI